ncbi:hypothetical protein YC2023_122279 [Brassica napus]
MLCPEDSQCWWWTEFGVPLKSGITPSNLFTCTRLSGGRDRENKRGSDLDDVEFVMGFGVLS